ncbi:MAG: hypothetical protein ABH840_02180 [Nanoarchaeota archaeon]
MYPPEIGALYQLKGEQSYYLITSFENPNMDEVKVCFKMPGTTQTFEYQGLDKVNSFLHNIERVSSISSELEKLAEQEKELNKRIEHIQSKKAFLQNPSKYQPESESTPSSPSNQGSSGTAYSGHSLLDP